MLTYKVTPLPLTWPGKATAAHARKRAPFKANWSRTLALLAREIRHLNGRNVEVAVDVDPRHIRQDGQLRADARTRTPAVVVSFDTPAARLAFPADRFAFWQDNVEAVARALEALRMVDRYGVQQGRQYAGFKALPASAAPTPTMAAGVAAQIIAEAAGRPLTKPDLLDSADAAGAAIRLARANTHPDRHAGERAAYDAVDAAAAVLLAHHRARTG